MERTGVPARPPQTQRRVAQPACTISAEGAPFLRVLCARACPVFAEAPSEAEGEVEGVGTTLIAQLGFAFQAAVSTLRYRHPFQPCHPERNFVIGKANYKVESKSLP